MQYTGRLTNALRGTNEWKVPMKLRKCGSRKGCLVNELPELLSWKLSQGLRQCSNATQIESARTERGNGRMTKRGVQVSAGKHTARFKDTARAGSRNRATRGILKGYWGSLRRDCGD